MANNLLLKSLLLVVESQKHGVPADTISKTTMRIQGVAGHQMCDTGQSLLSRSLPASPESSQQEDVGRKRRASVSQGVSVLPAQRPSATLAKWLPTELSSTLTNGPRMSEPPSPARAPACPICVRPLSFCETLFAPHCGYLCHLACMQLVVQGDLRGDKPSNPRLRAVRCPICHSRHPMAACVDGGLEKTPPGKAHLKSDFPKDAQPGRESSRGGGLYEPGFPPDPRLRGPRTGGVPENRAPKSPPGTSHAAPAKPPKLNSRILKSAPSSMSSCGGPVGRPSGPPQNMTGPRPNPPLVKAPPSPQVLRRTQSLGDASEFFEALELSRLREVDKGDPAGALARPGVAPSDARYRVQYAPPPGLLDAQISGRCKCGCRAAAQNVGGRVKVVAHNEAGRTMDAIYWSHVANSRGHSPASTALARTKSM